MQLKRPLRRAAGAGLLTALVAGAWLASRGDQGEVTARARGRAQDPVERPAPARASSTPALLPGPAAQRGVTPEVTPPPGPGATPAQAPSAGGAPARPTLDELVERLRRTVEPQAWSPRGSGELSGRGCVLVARAAPDVLDALASALAELRGEARAQPVAPAPRADAPPATTPEPRPSEARAALHGVARSVLAVQERLEALGRAVEAGELDDARALLEQVRAAQPDLALLGAAEQAITSRSALADLRRSLEALAQAPTLEEWLLRWPSAAT